MPIQSIAAVCVFFSLPLLHLSQLSTQKLLAKAIWIKGKAEQLVLHLANVKSFDVEGLFYLSGLTRNT